MRVERLPFGMFAPSGSDFIRIERAQEGQIALSGLVMRDRSKLNYIAVFQTQGEAEQAGLSWAGHHGAERVFVEVLFDQSAGGT